MDTLFAGASSASKAVKNQHIALRNGQRAQQSLQNSAQQLVITHSKDWWSIISEFVLIGGSLAALGYMFKSLIAQQNDPEGNKKAIAEHCKRVLLAKMQKSGRQISAFNTNTYEDSLLDMIVLPASIEVKFGDIGGLEHIKRDLTETVLVPLIYPQLTGSSRLCAPPLGVLFHGPPGTGKSMMAKAIARETNATFFNVDMSRLMSKWYGDSQKYISALFSLARKMAPSIIWIDEIDALFSQRSRSDHSADVYNKALFLSLWDGLAGDVSKEKKQSQSGGGVIILGASNRPQQVDEAFLRRMSRQYEFAMPDAKTRRLILGILLKSEKTHVNVDLDVIAQRSELYSGSDLKELCKYAATLPLREYVRRRSASPLNLQRDYEDVAPATNTATNNGQTRGWSLFGGNVPASSASGAGEDVNVNVMDVFEREQETFELRPIEQSDLLTALQHIKSTTKAHNEHERKYGGAQGRAGMNSMNGINPLLSNLGLWASAASAQRSAPAQQKAQESVEQDQADADNDAFNDELEVE